MNTNDNTEHDIEERPEGDSESQTEYWADRCPDCGHEGICVCNTTPSEAHSRTRILGCTGDSPEPRLSLLRRFWRTITRLT